MELLLGFWGNRVQLLLWMISLTTGRSGGTGGGGTRLMPAIMGLMGAMSPRPGSNLWMHRESAGDKRQHVSPPLTETRPQETGSSSGRHRKSRLVEEPKETEHPLGRF